MLLREHRRGAKQALLGAHARGSAEQRLASRQLRQVIPHTNQFTCRHRQVQYDLMLLKLVTEVDAMNFPVIPLPPNPCQRPNNNQPVAVGGYGIVDGTLVDDTVNPHQVAKGE